jgi:hypothetical protein
MQRVPMSVTLPLRWTRICLVAGIGAVRKGRCASGEETRRDPPTISRAPDDPGRGAFGIDTAVTLRYAPANDRLALAPAIRGCDAATISPPDAFSVLL